MTRKNKSPFDTVVGNLGQLTKAELVQLEDIVARLISIVKAEEDDPIEVVGLSTQAPAKTGPKGHIEAKKINGYGPYAYLRYRSGGRLRSKYLGKFGEDGAIKPPSKGGS